MILTFGILGLLWRVACAFVLILILAELRWAQKRDGETLRRLRGVFAGVLFVFCFPLVAALDHYTDISPGFEWRPYLEAGVWIGYATLFTCLIRFWLSLHRWARGEKETNDGPDPS